MRTLTHTSQRLVHQGFLILASVAALAAGPATASATSSVDPAPTYEEIRETAQKVGVENARAGLAPTNEEILETWEKLGLADPQPGAPPAAEETRKATGPGLGSPAAASNGFPTVAVTIGGSIGAGIGLTIAALALLAGRRRGQPVGT